MSMRAETATAESVRALTAGALRITGVSKALLLTWQGVMLAPVVSVDARRRPDVADLARVHSSELGMAGQGDTWSVWAFILDGRGGGQAVLDVRQLRPVQTTFKLQIDLRNRRLLRDIAEAGGVGLAVGGNEGGAVVFYQVPTEDLAAVLGGTVAGLPGELLVSEN